MATKPKKKKKTSPTKSPKVKKKGTVSSPKVVTPEVVHTPKSAGKSLAVPAAADHETGLTALDPIAKYMAEVKRYPVLSKEDEFKIASQYRKTGDPQLAQMLVTSNLRFVVKVAAEYSKFGAKLIDLIQEGNIGLMHAVKEFNPYKGVRLITYAVWWIRGYIQEYLMRQYSMVRIGTTQNQRKLFYQLQKQKEEFDRLGHDESIKQISGQLGIPQDEVKYMTQRVYGRDVSLDKPVGDDDSTTLMELQQGHESDGKIDEYLAHQEEIQKLTSEIDKIRPDLNDREVFILENRLLADEPLTLQEIGEKYGITREAVRQLEARLISKIKNQMLTTT